jgi:hypothetical protein
MDDVEETELTIGQIMELGAFTEGRRQRAGGRGERKKAKGKGQRAEGKGRRKKAEGRGQRAEGDGGLPDCCSRSIGPHLPGYSYKHHR